MFYLYIVIWHQVMILKHYFLYYITLMTVINLSAIGYRVSVIDVSDPFRTLNQLRRICAISQITWPDTFQKQNDFCQF